jgi:tartrate dehydratase beta subunit/fumarate hydratase class I family protein
MRMIKIGPTDLRVTEVLDGVKQGDQVVLLGSILTERAAVPPRLEIAENMKRAPITGPSSAAARPGVAATTGASSVPTTTAQTAQAGKPTGARKSSRP